ncbi:LpxI family protein [Magnetofaba australis]|uniref:UDP-2,3-diacylglucosamine pyrophosphatase n=1 Tax=Magnetofaba australis IT-1 TaxID=1434232 RepID=A0A1Y2K738_9PROT|nr:UDP-2,3-diacylglucosamine diphosphatase LpxI [Magnetofaba australis]OSM05168.1 hypothetical protein MAIT1_03321 [Magnetofaba australis IT-1]
MADRPPDGSAPVIGIIAGNGALPLILADKLRADGHRVVAVGHEGETDPELAQRVDGFAWVKLGKFKTILKHLAKWRATEAVMCGGIAKSSIWRVRPDALALRMALSLRTLHDDVLLRAIAQILEDHGMTLRGPAEIAPSLLAPAGVLTRRQPTPEQWEDIHFGFEMASRLGEFDIGQGVVTRQRVVVAVEAVEGTDAMIARAGTLCRGDGALVKVCKPGQDLRLDLPTIGSRTIENLHAARIPALGIEAGRTLIMDLADTLALADRYGMTLVALERPASPAEEKPA